MYAYTPADALAAVNVASIATDALRSDRFRTAPNPRLRCIIAVGQDAGRRTSSIVLVALAAWADGSGVEFASYVVDHATGAMTNGQYYGHDGFEDAWNLFALRTMPSAH